MSFCHNKQYEREFASHMCDVGCHCERVAGSGSAQDAVCDCVLFRDGKGFLVEVKSTRDKVFYVRRHIRAQLGIMQQKALEQGIFALLAVKFKHRGWQEINITDDIPEVIRW
jgi:Holliday junction resolvase